MENVIKTLLNEYDKRTTMPMGIGRVKIKRFQWCPRGDSTGAKTNQFLNSVRVSGGAVRSSCKPISGNFRARIATPNDELTSVPYSKKRNFSIQYCVKSMCCPLAQNTYLYHQSWRRNRERPTKMEKLFFIYVCVFFLQGGNS